ncbi:MAG: glutamate--cysteine ligase [Gammaproteobacteria bacterium]|nr:glutamate--cysteine ligase [Gammaproteobacteria bacterium]MDH5652447.1 glutamate--cysteine ligase [Gammaproteobacteria bacterium]
MGEEIRSSQFTPEDHARFRQQLEAETDLLEAWFEQERFAPVGNVAGFELESWLVDQRYRPSPTNAEFLEMFDNPLASPELASFNVEVNSTPRALSGHVFSAMHNELTETWQRCRRTAAKLDNEIVMVGILPTVENEHLNLANMSKMERYRALNRAVFRMRQGKPIVLDITGVEHLRVTHRDVMLESAATSFQIHLQMAQRDSVRLFNAGTVLCAPLVAMAANSPFLFGKDLWDETRIPLFEQSVAVGGFDGAAFGPIRRVTFGSGYVRHSLMECFRENREHYPILLPVELTGKPEEMPHLRLQNGTIWRWNRPLIGYESDGTPHLRMEQRVVAAGPSVVDEIANAAFFYGAVTALANAPEAIETQLKFDRARDNFYAAARYGLRASVNWVDDRQIALRDLILKILLPMAEEGLTRLDVASSDRQLYLGIIRERVETGSNGAHWQRAYVAKHGRNMAQLTGAYLERQNSGEPVHGWTV